MTRTFPGRVPKIARMVGNKMCLQRFHLQWIERQKGLCYHSAIRNLLATIARIAGYKICLPRFQKQWIEQQRQQCHHIAILSHVVTMLQ